MAMTYLTKLKPEPMGAYSLSTAYGVNSLVMSEDGAAAYISVKDVPAGTPLTNTEYWKIYTDLSAVKQSAEAAAQKANAARNEMLEIARNLTDMVEKNGNPVQAELVGGLPFDRVETLLAPIQAGSGDPSPTNIRAISGRTSAKLTRCGKNLAKAASASGVTSRNSVALWIDADLKPNTQYTLSFTATAGNKLYTNEYLFTTSVYMTTSGSRQSITFTTKEAIDETDGHQYTSGKGWVILKTGATLTTATEFTDVQLELGSTATAYEPYQGDTYAASFGQTVYGGTLDWQTGVLTVDMLYRKLTSADIASSMKYVSGYVGAWTNEILVGSAISAYNNTVICNLLPQKLVYGNAEQGIYINSPKILGIQFKGEVFDGYTDTGNSDQNADLIKAYLDANDVHFAYKLATPQTIQLTPQEIKQLQGMNTLYGDGSISMTGRADKALALEARIAALEAAG